MIEIWKDVEGYEDHYQVSSLGRIKRLEREYSQLNGLTGKLNSKILSEMIMNLTEDKDGYLRVSFIKDNKRKKFYVHRLVAKAFIPNTYEKPQVNHISGDKKDNRVESLEWVTVSENAQHAHDNKLYDCQRGSRNGRAKLTELDVNLIHDLYINFGYSQKQLAEKFSVRDSAISRILTGERWKHVYAQFHNKQE